MKIINIFLRHIIGLALISCSSNPDQHGEANGEQNREAPSVAITQWTDQMEIFMEYEQPLKSKTTKFIIHLTTLSDFQPVREGKVTLVFVHESGNYKQIEENELLREGIFTPSYLFEESGNYNFSISYSGKKAEETFAIGTLTVYENINDMPEEESAEEGISFLKEQQWKIDFATEEAENSPVKASIIAVGEVIPRQQSYADIVAPVGGILSVDANQHMVGPGQRVQKGQTLALLSPPLEVANSWAQISLNYEQAKSEFERATRLHEKNAISDRKYEEARRTYQLQKAGYASYLNSDQTPKFDTDNQYFQLFAPITGMINDVYVLPGQMVTSGQKLFNIIDPSQVWLQVNVFESEYQSFDEIHGLSLYLPGKDEAHHLQARDLKLISRGARVDATRRTIPLLIEINNQRQNLMIGQVFKAQIYTSAETEMLTIPSNAVYDDNTQKVVFVHLEGETFVKREVKTGPKQYDRIAITSGLAPYERVVTKGGYLVKLASSSDVIGHPHTH